MALYHGYTKYNIMPGNSKTHIIAVKFYLSYHYVRPNVSNTDVFSQTICIIIFLLSPINV